MKVGDYVRTNNDLGIQLICKIKKIIDEDFINTDKGNWDTEYIIKSSPNIIDLIEVGDYVNGNKVDYVGNKYLTFYDGDGDINLFNDDIKSIVTREQFEFIEYEVK